jgi:PAS domain S-box-containing protein
MAARDTISHDARAALVEFMLSVGEVSVFLWGVAYLLLGRPAAALVQGGYFLVVLASILWVRSGRANLRAVVWVHSLAIFSVCIGNTLALGGVAASGVFVVWGVVPALAALTMLGWRAAALAFAGYVAVAVACVAGPVPAAVEPLPPTAVAVLTVANVIGAPVLLLASLGWTLRRLAREQTALQASGEELRAILENTPAAVFLEDAGGRLAVVNRRFRELLGGGDAPLEDVPTRAVVPGKAGQALDDTRRAVLGTGRSVEREVRLDGGRRPRWLRVVRFPLHDGAGAVRAVGAIVSDVSDEKRLQEDAFRRQKLESLGTLAGGIAHDFNNVLMAFAGNVGVARAALEPGHPAAPLLEQAEKAITQATALSAQLLTFARGGAPVRRRTSIGPTVREAAAFVLHGSGTALELAVPDDLWPVEADLGQISQVVHSLVLNARQAMGDAGTVRVTGANVELPAAAEGQPPRRHVRLSVADEGPGIPPEVAARIFDPYFSTRPGGTGLGLSTGYAIARKHEGSLTFEGRSGRGTVFHLLLPAAAPESAPESARSGRPGPLRVLVMDDEPAVREVLVAMLRRLGCEPSATAEGEAAVAELRAAESNGGFDAAILDLTIKGGLGGVETVSRLLALRPDLPVIASSGYAADPVLADPGRFGFRAALRKPYTLAELRACLEATVADCGRSAPPAAGSGPPAA